jgi:integrase
MLLEEVGGIVPLYYWTLRGSSQLEHAKQVVKLRHDKGEITALERQLEESKLSLLQESATASRRALEKLGLLAPVADPKNPRLTAAMESWFEDRKQSELAIKRHRFAVRRFVELHGDCTVRDITRTMVESYRAAIENLTDHRRIPSRQRGSLEQVEWLAKVCAKTVERHLVSIKALLAFCLERDWVSKNVATGVKPPKDHRPRGSRRRSMTREERTRFLARAIEEHGTASDIVWLIKVAAYTGCRLEEMGQLSRSNVRQFDGIWAIEIDDLDGRVVKSSSSLRIIPLHPAIRDEFLDWLGEKSEERVFSSFKKYGGRYSTKLSGDMARLMDRAGLADPRLVMHSFRHGLKKAMADAGIDGEYRRLILGHRPRDVHEADYEIPSFTRIAQEYFKMEALF